MAFSITLLSVTSFAFAQSHEVTTYAGTRFEGYNDGHVTVAQFHYPFSVALTPNRDLYVADNTNNVIRIIYVNGTVDTYAGNGTFGIEDNVDALHATFTTISDILLAPNGDLYIAHPNERIVRIIYANGTVDTYAGTGLSGIMNGDALTQAQFREPIGLALAPNGDLYVSDHLAQTIRVVYTNGTVDTYAGNGAKYATDGYRLNATLITPNGIAFDSSGNLYIAETHSHNIRIVYSNGTLSTYAGNGTYDRVGGSVDGPRLNATFAYPIALIVVPSGDVYVASGFTNQIRIIYANGTVKTFAGSGIFGAEDGPALNATLHYPSGLAFDAIHGELYVADRFAHKIRRVSTLIIIDDATTNDIGNVITLTFSKNITITGNIPNTDFTLSDTTITVRNISITNNTSISLNLSDSFLANQTINLSYSQTQGTIIDLTNNNLHDFINQSVNNAVPKTPPTIINASTNNAGNIITITFNENITLAGPVPNSAFIFTNTNANVSSISRIPSTQIQLLLDTPVLANETDISLKYVSSSNNITDLNGTALGNVTNQSISNDMPKTPPSVTNISTNLAGNTITLTFNESIILITSTPSDFATDISNVTVNDISVLSNDTMILLNLNGYIMHGQNASLSYTPTKTKITDANGTALESFNKSVSNLVASASMFVNATTTSDGKYITILFSENITLDSNVIGSQFTLQGTPATTLPPIISTNDTITLVLATRILANETVTISYNGTPGMIVNSNDVPLENFANNPVSNSVPKTPPIIINASTNKAGNIITITFNEDIDLVDSVPNSDFTFTNTNANVSSISRIPSTQIQLLLDTPVLANETDISLKYVSSSNNITDLNGTALGNVTNQSISNDMPKTPPSVTNISTNLAGNTITLTFNESIILITSTPSDFATDISNVTVNDISVLSNDTMILLNLNGYIMHGQNASLSYTPTKTKITDANGTALESFNKSVSNLVASASMFVNATTTSDGKYITILFSENITLDSNVIGSQFTLQGTPATTLPPIISTNDTITLVLATRILANETVTISYNGTPGMIVNSNDVPLENFANNPVSNSVPKTPPIIINASTNNAGNIITITFNENITLAGPVPNSDFTFTNTNANVSSISRIPSTQIQLLLDTPVLANETDISLKYVSSSNNITDLNGTALGNVTNQSISNDIPKTPPIIIDTSTNNLAGNIITITFDKNITLAGTVPNSDFAFSNTKATVSSINQTSPSKQIQLNLNPLILANETGINLGYRNSSNNITDLNGTALGDIELMSDGISLSVYLILQLKLKSQMYLITYLKHHQSLLMHLPTMQEI